MQNSAHPNNSHALMRTLLTTITFVLLLSSSQSMAFERISRLGVGYSGQLKNGVPALSFKLQKSKSFAFGGVLGLSNKENGGGTGAALKIYRNIFDEPHLTFYGSVLGGIISKKSSANTDTGFQADLTLGSEFSFAGLQSLGFSVEFGASFYKLNHFISETVGNNFLVSAVHFYL